MDTIFVEKTILASQWDVLLDLCNAKARNGEDLYIGQGLHCRHIRRLTVPTRMYDSFEYVK